MTFDIKHFMTFDIMYHVSCIMYHVSFDISCHIMSFDISLHFMRGRHSFGHGFDLAVYFFPHEDAPELPVTAGVGLGFWVAL